MAQKRKIKILNIVGARPNFMKIAPLFRVYKENKSIHPILVHTNQHSDNKMSGVFFKSLGIPNPKYILKTDNSSPIKSLSSMLLELDSILDKERPDIVVVVGDVNSTLAGALSANKLGIKVAHVESGLRSKDRSMPEEINRILVDHVSDFLFVTEKSGVINLKNEGILNSRIYFVGNVMIDNLINMLPKIDKSKINRKIGLENCSYTVITMHRPVNVDSKKALEKLFNILEIVGQEIKTPIVFPVHPRTVNNLKKYNLWDKFLNIPKIVNIDPLNYVDFIKLIKESSFIMTDSGGIQEEAAYLKIPTITLRESTERPSTVLSGANVLHSTNNIKGLAKKINTMANLNRKSIKDIPFNDGRVSQRIVNTILKNLFKKG